MHKTLPYVISSFRSLICKHFDIFPVQGWNWTLVRHYTFSLDYFNQSCARTALHAPGCLPWKYSMVFHITNKMIRHIVNLSLLYTVSSCCTYRCSQISRINECSQHFKSRHLEFTTQLFSRFHVNMVFA